MLEVDYLQKCVILLPQHSRVWSRAPTCDDPDNLDTHARVERPRAITGNCFNAELIKGDPDTAPKVTITIGTVKSVRAGEMDT